MQIIRISRGFAGNDLPVKLLLFIFCPFGAFVLSLLDPSKKSSYVIYWLFGILFCWLMYFKGPGIDFNNIVLRFYSQPDLSFHELICRMTNIYSGESADKDVYNLLLNWVVRQFTNNFHVLFAVAAIPFLFFMLKSLKFITDDKERFSNDIICYIVILLFLLPKDIFSVQNFRFATATWMGIYSVIKIFYSRERIYLILLCLTPLIHSSFWFYVGLVVVYFFFKGSSSIKYIYYLSLLFVFIPIDILSGINFSLLPASLANWAQHYISEDMQQIYGMNAKGSGYRWVSDAFEYMKIISYTIAIITMINGKILNNIKDGSRRLFNFHLWSLSIINFCQVIPVLGTRFLNNSMIITIFLWYKIMYPKKNWVIVLMLFSCSFEILYTKVKHYSMVISSDLFYQNLISLISKHWGVDSF